jgi:hypothetical protein
MARITADDLIRSMKLLGTQIPEERLDTVADCLYPTLQAFRPLDEIVIGKEFEPTTFVFLLLNRRRFHV